MLNSKELLEKTGISRATLNNYIALGIVPKPDVLPPEPQDGAAPRIGYFPENAVERVAEIQRLKNEGWSMAAIAEHFAGTRSPGRRPAPLSSTATPTPTPAAAAAAAVLRPPEPPALSLGQFSEPAHLVDRDFALVWANAAATAALGEHPAAGSVLQALAERDGAPDELLLFHLAVAREQGVDWPRLAGSLAPAARRGLQGLFEHAEALGAGPVWHRAIVAESGFAFWYAVQCREGTLFVQVPSERAGEELSALLADGHANPEVPRRRPPVLSEVAVLAMDLHDAARIWSALPAEEYFELIDQIWTAAEPILRRRQGTTGKHPADGIVCYFTEQRDGSHAWNALLAAHDVREAMRRVSKEWQLRKRWSLELYLNSGIDEGQQWLGSLRSGHTEFTTFGETLHRATRLSEFARFGAIWATKNLLMQLAPHERERLRYGVQRRDRDGHHHFVPTVFATVDRLADVTALGPRAQDIARLPITEILDIAAAPSRRAGGLEAN